MDGPVADVLELELPAAGKLLLDAGCPLNHVRRMVLGGKDNVLRLREELRGSRSGNLGLREGISRDGAYRPRAAEAYRSGWRDLLLTDGRGIGRVLLIPLSGEEVDLVVTQRCAGAEDRFAQAEGIVGQTEVWSELPRGVLRELFGNTRIAVEGGSCGRIWVNRTNNVVQEIVHVENNSAVEVVRRHEVGRPAHAAGQGQLLGGAKRVLCVDARDRAAERILLLFALLE